MSYLNIKFRIFSIKFEELYLQRLQFGPGLCFYPEFGVPVWRKETLFWSSGSEKGPGPTLVLQVWSWEKGPGLTLICQVRGKESAKPWFSRYCVRRKKLAEPWLGRLEFGEKTGLNHSLAGSKLGGSEFGEKTAPNHGLAGLEKGMSQTLVPRFRVRRKYRSEPWFRVWVRSSKKRTVVWQF